MCLRMIFTGINHFSSNSNTALNVNQTSSHIRKASCSHKKMDLKLNILENKNLSYVVLVGRG